jgi:hypothetical protein
VGYTSTSDLTACTICPAGSYVNDSGDCVLCPAGTYNALTGQTSCTSCPVGTYNPNNGSTVSTVCVSCAAGYASKPGATSCYKYKAKLDVILAVDNSFTLYINGEMFNQPPNYEWYSPFPKYTVYTETDPPYIIAVDAIDRGVIAGFMAAVYYNGVPFAATGNVPGLRSFKVSKTTSNGWNTSINFNDDAWVNATTPVTCVWPNNWLTNFRTQTGIDNVNVVWKDSCNDIYIHNYFRLVFP